MKRKSRKSGLYRGQLETGAVELRSIPEHAPDEHAAGFRARILNQDIDKARRNRP